MHMIQFLDDLNLCSNLNLCSLEGWRPLPWLRCSLMWMFYEHLQMLLYLSCINSFILLHIWPQLNLLSTGSTQEDQSQHDWKIADWDIKNQTSKHYNTIFRLPQFVFLRGLAPLPWPSCSLMRMFYEHLQVLLHLSCINCFILLQIWPQLIGLSTGSTQEGQSQHDWKTVDWNLKNENKTFNCFILCYRYDLSLIYLVLVQPRKASPNMTEK